MSTVADSERERAAFVSLDDAVALAGTRPVAVDTLWRSLLECVSCGAGSVVVIHPSWWTPSRVSVVGAAAAGLGDEVVMKPRSWLVRGASQDSAAIVEIADGFVVVTGESVAAHSRRREDEDLVEAVVGCIAQIGAEAVIIDAPRTVRGAGALSAMIANAVRKTGVMVTEVGDIELRRLVGGCVSATSCQPAQVARHRCKLVIWAPIAGLILGALLYHPARTKPVATASTYLAEGHVALQVPQSWPVRRVVSGPGSARLQITSPSDPEVALHVTQSRVASQSLEATAEFLRAAIDAAPAGVFVDFDPAARSTGRTLVTYREVRSGHDIRWAVWIDKAVRISIGCQSRRGHDDAVRVECDLALRSARALM